MLATAFFIFPASAHFPSSSDGHFVLACGIPLWQSLAALLGPLTSEPH